MREKDEFLIGLTEVSSVLTDLLVTAEENNYMHDDKKVFKLLSKAFLAVQLAYAIQYRRDVMTDAEFRDEPDAEVVDPHYGPIECPF